VEQIFSRLYYGDFFTSNCRSSKYSSMHNFHYQNRTSNLKECNGLPSIGWCTYIIILLLWYDNLFFCQISWYLFN